jgi:hypothetical protein
MYKYDVALTIYYGWGPGIGKGLSPYIIPFLRCIVRDARESILEVVPEVGAISVVWQEVAGR